MGKSRNGLLLCVALSIVMMTTFVLSCSNVNPNSGPSSTAKTTESTPSQTIETYEDLEGLKFDDPANIDNSEFPITPVKAIHVTGGLPLLDMSKYTLSVGGLANNPLSLSYDAILKYPSISEVVLLICEGTFVDNAEWTGVPVTALLTEAGVKPEATKVAFIAVDGYEIHLTILDIQKGNVFLAYKVNGEILPPEHGYPIRLVVKGKYGSFWVKWVNRLEIL